MKKKYSITDEDYRVLETTIIKMEPHKAGPQWKFIGAFYFATVVLVMIGSPAGPTSFTKVPQVFTAINLLMTLPTQLLVKYT